MGAPEQWPEYEPVPGDEQPVLFELEWEREALSQPEAQRPWFWFPAQEEPPAEESGQLDFGLEDTNEGPR